jgi:hypothetical protein
MGKVVKMKPSRFDRKKFWTKFEWMAHGKESGAESGEPNEPGEPRGSGDRGHPAARAWKSWIILFGVLAAGGVAIFLLVPGSIETTARMTAALAGILANATAGNATAATTVEATTTAATTTVETTSTTTTTTIPTTTTTLPPASECGGRCCVSMSSLKCSDTTHVITMNLTNFGNSPLTVDHFQIMKFYINDEAVTFGCSPLPLVRGDAMACSYAVTESGSYEVEVYGPSFGNVEKGTAVCS